MRGPRLRQGQLRVGGLLPVRRVLYWRRLGRVLQRGGAGAVHPGRVLLARRTLPVKAGKIARPVTRHLSFKEGGLRAKGAQDHRGYGDTCGVAVYSKGILALNTCLCIGEHGYHKLRRATTRGVCWPTRRRRGRATVVVDDASKLVWCTSVAEKGRFACKFPSYLPLLQHCCNSVAEHVPRFVFDLVDT